MRVTSWLPALFAVCALTACMEHTPAARVPAPASVAPSSGLRAPMVASWLEVRQSPTSAVLRARIERSAGFPLPLTVTVSIPSGVQLVRGPRTYTLPPASAAETHETEFELAYAQPPAEDLVLVADAQDPAFGVHAEVPYRFGRPEPVGPRPQPGGSPLRIGAHDFGAPVPVQPVPVQGSLPGTGGQAIQR